MNVATTRHVNYALGYLALGLVNEAHDELAAIDPHEVMLPPVLAVRVDLHLEEKHWEIAISVARELTQVDPHHERGWVGWAYALRELGRVTDAKAVLLEAEPRHGATSAVLHYNLACYHCLLGEIAEARMRLETAFRMHPPFRAEAREDPDLDNLHDDLVH